MAIYCRVVLNPAATPGQLSAVGTAMWEWCTGAANGDGIYQYLGNQGLADLIAGRLPAPDPDAEPAARWGVRFGIRDGAFPDLRAVIDSLRRALPAAGVGAVSADGMRGAGGGPTPPAPERPDGTDRRDRSSPAGPGISGPNTLNPEDSP